MRLRYLATTEVEIRNFICIYLEPVFNDQNDDIGDFFLMKLEFQEFVFVGDI